MKKWQRKRSPWSPRNFISFSFLQTLDLLQSLEVSQNGFWTFQVGAAQFFGKLSANIQRFPIRVVCQRGQRSGHNDELMQESSTSRRDQMVTRTNRAGSFSDQGHVIWLASEGRDILLHPVQGHVLIPKGLEKSLQIKTVGL